MKKYLICIILLMSVLCVYSQTDSTLERRNYLDGYFSFGTNDYKISNKSSTSTSAAVSLAYGFLVKKNAQHGIGISSTILNYNDGINGGGGSAIGIGVFYQYLYQKYLNKKLAVFGSWSPKFFFYGRDKITTNSNVSYSINNNLGLGLSYDLDKHWTIRTTLLEYENVYSSNYETSGLRGNEYYRMSNNLSFRSFVNGISIRYYY